MDVQGVAVDVHQLLYRRPTLHKWTSISFSMNVLHDIRGRPRVSIWAYNMWPWTSTSYYMDVQSYIRGRPPVSIWTYNMWSWTSTTYCMNVQHFISGCPSVSSWTYDITSMDVDQFLYERSTYGHGRPCTLFLYARTKLHKWTSISFSMDVQHNIRGHPPVSI